MIEIKIRDIIARTVTITHLIYFALSFGIGVTARPIEIASKIYSIMLFKLFADFCHFNYTRHSSNKTKEYGHIYADTENIR